MKNKQKMSIIALITTLSSTLSTFSNMSAAVINFELYNKENQTITIDLDGQRHTAPAKSTKKTLQLTINPTKTHSITVNSHTAGSQQFTINPSTQRKTIYLTWNPGDTSKKSPLYPQTGPWMGFLGKTESGLTLDKKTNVTTNEIQNRIQPEKPSPQQSFNENNFEFFNKSNQAIPIQVSALQMEEKNTLVQPQSKFTTNIPWISEKTYLVITENRRTHRHEFPEQMGREVISVIWDPHNYPSLYKDKTKTNNTQDILSLSYY